MGTSPFGKGPRAKAAPAEDDEDEVDETEAEEAEEDEDEEPAPRRRPAKKAPAKKAPARRARDEDDEDEDDEEDEAPRRPAKKAPAKKPAARRSRDDDEDEDGGTEIGKKQDPFAMPSGGGSDYKIAEFVGELLLIRPTEEGEMMTKVSKDGPSKFVRVDLYRLDNEDELVEDLLVFQEALIRNFRKVMRGPNEWVLGRLDRGEEKKGKDSAPYILETPDAADVKQARALMKSEGLL